MAIDGVLMLAIKNSVLTADGFSPKRDAVPTDPTATAAHAQSIEAQSMKNLPRD